MKPYAAQQLQRLELLRALFKLEGFDLYRLRRHKHPLEFLANRGGYEPSYLVRLYRGKIKIRVFLDPLITPDKEEGRLSLPKPIHETVEKLQSDGMLVFKNETEYLPKIKQRRRGRLTLTYFGWTRFLTKKERDRYSRQPRLTLNACTKKERRRIVALTSSLG